MGIPAPLGVAAAGLPNLGDQANAVVSGQLKAVGPTAPFAFRGPMNLLVWGSIVATLTTTAGSLAATLSSATGLAAGNAIASKNVPAGATIGALAGTNVTLALPPITLSGSVDTNGLLSGLESTTGLVGATVTVPSNNEGVTLPAGTTVTAVVKAAVPAGLNVPAQRGSVQLSAAPTAVPVLTGPVPFQFAPTGNAVTTTGADAAASFTGAAVNYSATVNIERSLDGGTTWLVCNEPTAFGTIAQLTAGTPFSITFGEPEKNVLYRLNVIAYTSGTINYRVSQTGGAAESLAIGPLSGG